MNPKVPQCKNYWKWDHTIFSCRSQGLKCIKCNKSHKSEHHCQFAWYYKANFKTNLLRFEKKNRANLAHIHSSVWIAKATIKQIWIYAPSKSINLIGSGIPRNTRNFMIVEDNQLTQLWVVFKHDLQKCQNFFTKHS